MPINWIPIWVTSAFYAQLKSVETLKFKQKGHRIEHGDMVYLISGVYFLCKDVKNAKISKLYKPCKTRTGQYIYENGRVRKIKK